MVQVDTKELHLSATRFVVSAGCHAHDAGAVIGVAITYLLPMVAWTAATREKSGYEGRMDADLLRAL